MYWYTNHYAEKWFAIGLHYPNDIRTLVISIGKLDICIKC